MSPRPICPQGGVVVLSGAAFRAYQQQLRLSARDLEVMLLHLGEHVIKPPSLPGKQEVYPLCLLNFLKKPGRRPPHFHLTAPQELVGGAMGWAGMLPLACGQHTALPRAACSREDMLAATWGGSTSSTRPACRVGPWGGRGYLP